jgi:hypothetical protein
MINLTSEIWNFNKLVEKYVDHNKELGKTSLLRYFKTFEITK